MDVKPFVYKCTLDRVVDGDTVDVNIDLGFKIVLAKQRVRLVGIDTPESRTRDLAEKKLGLEAKELLKELTYDGFVLELLEYPSHPTEPQDISIINVGVLHIALSVYDSDEVYDHLVKNNVKVLSKPVLSSEKIAKVFFCLDPDGTRVEIVEMLN